MREPGGVGNDEMNQNVGSWSGSTLTLSTDKVMGHTVKLKVKALDVNQDVNKETASVDILTEVIYVTPSIVVSLLSSSKLV